MRLFLMVLSVFAVSVCMAQGVSPAPSPSPAAASGIIPFLTANFSVIIAPLVVAILDLVFALNPNANSPDGILHAVYLFFKGNQAPKA